MAAADVNHDGKLDLLVVTARGSASLQVLFGNGDGSFTPGPVSAFDIYEVDTIVTGDFDGECNVDVAAVWLSGPPADGPAGGGGRSLTSFPATALATSQSLMGSTAADTISTSSPPM